MTNVKKGGKGLNTSMAARMRSGQHMFGDTKVVGRCFLNGYEPNRDERRAMERLARKNDKH